MVHEFFPYVVGEKMQEQQEKYDEAVVLGTLLIEPQNGCQVVLLYSNDGENLEVKGFKYTKWDDHSEVFYQRRFDRRILKM